MRQHEEIEKRGRSGVAMLAAAALVVMFAAGCDSRVDIKGPRINLPTVPTVPTAPSGPSITQSRPISGVSGVTLQAVGHVRITMGGAESLIISAPESIMELLTSDVMGGELVLGRDSGSYSGQASDIQYEITVRQLDRLTHEGVGQIAAEGIDTGRFSAHVNGIGEVEASGRADRQEVRVSSGLSGYNASRLESRVANVNLSAGRAEIWATARIEGRVGFGCTLEYWGDPELAIEGRGTVRRLGSAP